MLREGGKQLQKSFGLRAASRELVPVWFSLMLLAKANFIPISLAARGSKLATGAGCG
jgi:hypothetical protein